MPTQRKHPHTRSNAKKPNGKTRAKGSLPIALARRAEALAAGKRTRLEKEAAGLIALVKRRKRAISEAFYDIVRREAGGRPMT